MAYADNLLVITAADIRRELENKGNEIGECILNWCTENGLKLERNKTELLTITDKLKGRSPIITNRWYKYKRESTNFKYLGVSFERKLGVTKHI